MRSENDTNETERVASELIEKSGESNTDAEETPSTEIGPNTTDPKVPKDFHYAYEASFDYSK